MGTKGTLTGEALFNRLNQNLGAVGSAILTSCPNIALADVQPLLSMKVTIVSGVITATYAETLGY